MDLSELSIPGVRIVPGKVIDDVEKTFGVIHLDGYGQTEGCGFTTLNPIVGVRKKGSVGVPIADIWVKIVDDDFVELQPRQVGEIILKGNVFSIHGYWKRPRSMKRPTGEDGSTAEIWGILMKTDTCTSWTENRI